MKHFKSALIVVLALAALLLTIAIPGLVVYYILGFDPGEAVIASLAWAVMLAMVACNEATADEDEDE